MDPERLIPCPYDKNHQIRASRFPYHLVKCGENNKQRAKELATCPYNARHKVPKRELQLHISTCTDNRAPELFSGTSMTFSPKKELKETPRSWQCPPCQEDWEADADESGATSPFVLGSKTNLTFDLCLSLGERGQDGNQQMQAVSTSAAAWTPKGHSWRNGCL
ncbi:gametocyte-specific factor 1-like [Malaclemys terrapin pileata]|uniref:gametocyte-specific factor 1-like n=1 Tax=Malaclemys terrapin pileata TaxID=2991368 RepID=UPI0023A8FF4A|nr:gametocyte-specific factor 1-like [Malaclemys terrapin pileata]XP_053868370.1 gametocyte-specific factor 1-like [Malaclemys terrapin pileata]